MQAIQLTWQRLTLVQQAAFTGLVLTTLVMLPLWAWSHENNSALAAMPGWGAAGLAGVLATAGAAWIANRADRALAHVQAAALGIATPTEGEEVQLPLQPGALSLHDNSAALRRAVEALRTRIGELEAQNVALGGQLRKRTHELTSLQDLSMGLAEQSDVGRLVDEALGALEQTMAYSSASVWARAGLESDQAVTLLGYRSSSTELSGLKLSDLTGLRLSRANLQRYEQIERDARPIIENRPRQSLLSWLWAMVTDDSRTSALYRSTRAWMAVPLKVRERVLGVLRVDHAEPDYFDDERVRLLRAVGSQTALAMRHAQLLSRERDEAVTAERNRIARDLHDAVSQTLFAANLVAGALTRDPSLDARAAEQIQTLERLNRGALAEMRMLMFELRPDALEGMRLAELLQHAISALAARGEIEVITEIDAGEPPGAQRVEVYRIAQEALSNVARHSGARHVQLRWKVTAPREGRLSIVDDGHGFDMSEDHPGHFGLENMRERARAMNGEAELTSTPGAGTRVDITIHWN